jgi:chromosome partitioning protein
VRLIQQNLNPKLRLTGIVLTMYNQRTRLSEQVVEEVKRYFGGRVYDTIIPRTVRLSEAPGFGQPITSYDPKSKGAKAYRNLAREFLTREAGEIAEVTAEPIPDMEPPSVIGVEKSDGGEER